MNVNLPATGRKAFALSLFIGICFGLTAQTSLNPYISTNANTTANSGIRFIENKNQWNTAVAHKLEMQNGAVFFEKDALTYSLLSGDDLEAFHDGSHPGHSTSGRHDGSVRGHAFKVKFMGASPAASIIGSGPYSDYRNYYIGSDESKWASNVLSYQELMYSGIYNGVDLKFYASSNNPNETSLKYDFIVHPGANPSTIDLKYEGLDQMYINDGNLYLVTSVNTVAEQKPYAYQNVNGVRVQVDCQYKLTGNRMGFVFPNGYNTNLDLIIDPVLVFSTYTGSTSDNFGFTATYDLQSNLYAGGIVYGVGYPTTIGAFQINFAGVVDVGITKFNPTGTTLLFSTFLGGNDTELPSSLVVNSQNELVVLGTTGSSNFPTSVTGYDRTFNGGAFVSFSQNGATFNSGTDIFVTKFNSTGTALGGSTFVGGSANDGVNQNSVAQLQYNYGDPFRGEVIVDSFDNIYVASSSLSLNFPITAGAFQSLFAGTQDAVVFKMNSNVSALTWSSYLGGSGVDAGYSLKLDGNNNVFVCGGTTSNNLASTTGALNPTYIGGTVDGYVAKINNAGTSLLRTSYMGTTSYDQCYFVDLDQFNNVYLFGQTRGTYPVTQGVYSNANTKQFIHKLPNDLNATLFSTTFGAGTLTNISPTAFLVDQCGHIYASGWGGNVNNGWNSLTGTTTGMPTTAGAFQTTTDGSDFYFIVLGPNASYLEYATFFGGNGAREHVDGGTSRFDKRGAIYQAVCAGCGGNSLFPTTPGVWSRVNRSSNCNLGAVKFDFQISAVEVQVQPSPSPEGCAELTVNFSDLGINAKSRFWNFGDGSTSTLANPTHTFVNPGVYKVMLIGYDSITCEGVVLTDTSYTNITVNAASSSERDVSICDGQSFFVGGALQTTAGTYSDTLTNAEGCDSVVITHLSLKPNKFTTVNVSICPGESYFAGGAPRTTPGAYRDTLDAANGCDSIITTNLSLLPNKFTVVDASICPGESYFAGGKLQTTAGTYQDTLSAANSCDSIITTNLLILQLTTKNVNADICPGDSYFAGGALQTQGGVYRDTIDGSSGCDTILITTLSIRPTSSTNLAASICPGESFFVGGSLQTQAGVYRDTITGSNGCDSILVTTLSIKPTSTTNLSVSICPGDSYFVGGALQTQQGLYRDTLTGTNGCDSILLTTLSFKPTSITNLSVSICPGDSYFVGGELQTQQGLYPDTLTGANGCDSILLTTLGFKPTSTTNVDVSICPGESYNASGEMQTKTGTYYDTLIAANGCDSVVITHLSIKPVSFTNLDASICPGESYFVGGALQTEAGVYLDTLTAANGCDSILITALVIKPISLTTVQVSICPGDTYLAGGGLQTEAGTYLDTLTAVNSCDSIITTVLSLFPTYLSESDTTICREQPFNGVIYTNDTTLVDSLLSVNGCDSIIVLNIFLKVCCPAPIVLCRDTLIPDNQQYCGEFLLTPPVVVSQCNVVSLTNDYAGGPFPVGTTVVTWIAVDEFGQSDTCEQNVTYSITGSLSSYTILGFEGVELMPTNDVRTGSVGVMKAGGEAYLQNHTKVTGPGSFVMAPVITTFPNTEVSNPIYAPANVALPVFEKNPVNYGIDISVPVNATMTLTDTVYGRISLWQGATVVFDNPHGVLNVKEIRVNNKAAGANTTLKFKQCMKVRVKERVDLGPKCTVNPDSLAVIFYVEGANASSKDNQPVVDIAPNAVVYADFYVPNGRFYAHPGSNVNPAQYIGTFIAKWVTGQPDIVWRRRGDCDHAYNCQGNQFKTTFGGSEEEFDIPMEIFPNPFKQTTTIGFTLKYKDENVSLKIVNVTGAVVAKLYEGSIEAGTSMRLTLNAAMLSNGVYHALLQTSNGVYSRKLIVVQ